MTVAGIMGRMRRALAARRGRRAVARLGRRLAGLASYDFTADYVSGCEESWLQHLGELRGRKVRILEVGSFEGRSAVWFLTHLLDHPEARLVCVDPFLDATTELRFDHNLRIADAGHKVTKLKGFSGSILPALEPHDFDLVYVDGSHRAADVLLDAVLGWELLRESGLLLFDDLRWRPDKPLHDRPELGVERFLGLVEGHYDLLFKEYQALLRKLG